ncbi:hypothetical protein A3841_14765 [Pontibacter flavimaris]|uniref:Uncharacterized protein n=1 Tax=Pontibacter flavimaris TaxID=1797110 RepID=A0A1Q5PFS8_9BACT|nr:hypothetical protein A3841_14765 [Pontibacter flavimaris]
MAFEVIVEKYKATQEQQPARHQHPGFGEQCHVQVVVVEDDEVDERQQAHPKTWFVADVKAGQQYKQRPRHRRRKYERRQQKHRASINHQLRLRAEYGHIAQHTVHEQQQASNQNQAGYPEIGDGGGEKLLVHKQRQRDHQREDHTHPDRAEHQGKAAGSGDQPGLVQAQVSKNKGKQGD